MKDVLKGILGNLDRGFYAEAKAHPDGPQASYCLISRMITDKGYYPEEAEIEKRVQNILFSIKATHDVRSVTPAAMQKIRDFAIETWGLEKLLTEANVRVKGAYADKLEKFYSTTSSTILFPAYVESQIMLGALANSLLADLIATERNIDSHTYQGIRLTDVEADQQMAIIGEGAEFPGTKIETAETAKNLTKYGRKLECTYESLRLQSIDLLGIFLQRMGLRLALDETDDAIQTLIAGDGNSGSAITNANDLDADVQGVLDYDELVKLFLAFGDGYNMTTSVTRTANLRTILNMAEFKDPMAGFSFQRTGALPGPMGANWHKWDSTNATSFPALGILAIDRSIALQQVTEQGVMTESDKLITSQWQRIAVSKWTGFSKLDYNAVKLLDINAEL